MAHKVWLIRTKVGAARLLTAYRHEAMRDLRCMSFTSKGTAEIIVAGMQNTMLVIDLNKGEVVKQVCPPNSSLVLLMF